MNSHAAEELSLTRLTIYYQTLAEEVVRAHGRLDEASSMQALVLATAVALRELPSLATARAIVRRRPLRAA
jgi:hypothetical protein